MYSYDEVYKATLEYFNGDELAANVWVTKYCLQDSNGQYHEKLPTDMFWRLAYEFARPNVKYKYQLNYLPTKQECLDQYSNYYAREVDRYFELLSGFEFLNAQGSVMSSIGNYFQVQSPINCSVLSSPIDSYGGILKTDQELVQLAKRRLGIGFDLSNLRPAGTPVSNAAKTSTGLVSFMERFSNSTREVAQFGRRGALLLSCSVHHPDIEAFICAKKDRTKVTGANISVMTTNVFMEAVKNNTTYIQQWPIDSLAPIVKKEVSARKIWDLIIDMAWENAEPGLLLIDNYHDNYPAVNYPGYRVISTNPSLHGDTLVCTSKEWKTIKSLYDEGSTFMVLNIQKEWKEATVIKTSDACKLFKLTLFGQELHPTLCSRQHEWPVEIEGLIIKKPTYLLKEGDLIPGWYSSRKVKSVVETDLIRDVYDITVFDETNTFLCNAGFTGNCGEIGMGEDFCRLMCVNLYSYVINPFTPEAYFDYNLWNNHCKELQVLGDNLVELDMESIDRIIKKVESDPEPEEVKQTELNLWKRMKGKALGGRRTGNGIVGLGDCLAALGLRYASEESIEVVDKIFQTQALACLESTIELAKERGPFGAYDYSLEENNYLRRLFNLKPELEVLHKQYGRRNICCLTIAPTGSVSCLTQTSSGIEPAIFLEYKRRRKLTDKLEDNMQVDFVDATGDKWQEYTVYHHKYKTWKDITGKDKVEDSPFYKSTAEEIDWLAGIKLQAAAQKYIDHSISRTVNLPADVSKEIVGQVYLEAWKQGLKGVTVYRAGSRDGVLVKSDDKGYQVNQQNQVNYHDAPRRPERVYHEIKKVKVNGQYWYVFVGTLENKPYEVFAGQIKTDLVSDEDSYNLIDTTTESVTLDSLLDRKDLFVYKRKFKSVNNKYDLCDSNGQILVKDIVSLLSSDEAFSTLTRMISLSLRHGAKPSFICEQLLRGAKEDRFDSFNKAISRVLKKYIEDGTAVAATKKDSLFECADNTQCNLVYQEGCQTCLTCGKSKCN